MQENFTVIDNNYETIKRIGEKKAKMGEGKILSIRNYCNKILLSQAPKEEKVENSPVQQPQVEKTEVKEVAKTENVSNEKTLQFPGKEVFEARFEKINAICYENFPGGVIYSHAARRLRTASIVPETLIYATSVSGKENIIEEKKLDVKFEEPQKEIPKEKFDFGQLVNQVSTPQPEPVTENREISKPMPSIDDYFKKEVGINQVEQEVDTTSVELQTARNNYENVLESYKTQCEIQEQLEKELKELRQQRVVKIEEYRQKTLEETQNLNDVLTKINQLKDAIDEEKKALGLIEDGYQKAI